LAFSLTDPTYKTKDKIFRFSFTQQCSKFLVKKLNFLVACYKRSGVNNLLQKQDLDGKSQTISYFTLHTQKLLIGSLSTHKPYTDIITDHGAQIRFQLSKCGYHPQQHRQLATIPLLATGSLKKKLHEAKTAGANLVFFVVIQANVSVYAEFKDLSDRYFGIHSICLVQKRDRNAEYFTSVMMKVNLKFSGTNHVVNGVLSGTRGKPSLGANAVILGAGVVHSGQTTFDGYPSIAAIVGSADRFVARYLGSVRLQSIDKIDREVSAIFLFEQQDRSVNIGRKLIKWRI
jgi:hypothetical protein